MKNKILLGFLASILIIGFSVNKKNVSATTIDCQGDMTQVCVTFPGGTAYGSKAIITTDQDAPDDGR